MPISGSNGLCRKAWQGCTIKHDIIHGRSHGHLTSGSSRRWRWANCNGLQWKWVGTALGLQSTAMGPHYMQLTATTVFGLSVCEGKPMHSRERLGGAPVSYISRPGAESVSSHLKSPY